MQVRPGTRLRSTVCDAEVVVVRAPTDVDLDLRCGGAPLVVVGTEHERVPATLEGPATLLGKRYVDEDDRVELLASKGGAGTLSIGDRPLQVKTAKALPASD